MVENTTNFELNKPSENERDWHIPLNENFDLLDKRLVITDIESELSTYDPINKQAFIGTDTGNIYVGDGNSWEKLDIQLGGIETDHVYFGKVSSTPSDNDIGAGNVALYFREDDVLYKKPYGGTESNVGGGSGSYSDSDAIAAINNDSDHGITASHNYYTDSDAVTAINNDSDHGQTATHDVLAPSKLTTTQIEETTVSTSVSSSYTVDVTTGSVFDVTLTGDISLSITGGGSDTGTNSFTLLLKQDSTGGRSISWPSSISWVGSGGAPPLSKAANAVDIFTFFSIDGGTTWYGQFAGQDEPVVDTGTVTLSGGSGTANTGITADTGKYYDVSVMPQSNGDVAASLEYDGSTIIVHVEENTTGNNPDVTYRLEELQ